MAKPKSKPKPGSKPKPATKPKPKPGPIKSNKEPKSKTNGKAAATRQSLRSVKDNLNKCGEESLMEVEKQPEVQETSDNAVATNQSRRSAEPSESALVPGTGNFENQKINHKEKPQKIKS